MLVKCHCAFEMHKEFKRIAKQFRRNTIELHQERIRDAHKYTVKYKTTTNWRNFASKIVLFSSVIELQSYNPVGFVRDRCLLGHPSMRSMIFPQSCRCVHRRDSEHHRYYNDRCLLGNPHYSAIAGHKYYCWDVGHLTLQSWEMRTSTFKKHFDFSVFTWPGHFIQRWFVTLYFTVKICWFSTLYTPSCGHSSLYQAILYNVGPNASRDWKMDKMQFKSKDLNAVKHDDFVL